MALCLTEQQQFELSNAKNTIFGFKHGKKYTPEPEKTVEYCSNMVYEDTNEKDPKKKYKATTCVSRKGMNDVYMDQPVRVYDSNDTSPLNTMKGQVKLSQFSDQQLSSLNDMIGTTYKVDKFIEKLQNTTNIYNLQKYSVEDLQSLAKAYFTKQHLERVMKAKKRRA